MGADCFHRVTEEEAGTSLQELVMRTCAGQTGLLALQRGGIWLGTQRIRDGSMPVAAGREIAVRLPPDGHYRDARITAEDILYEDEDLIILNKAPGYYVGATPWDDEGHMQAALQRYLQNRGISCEARLLHQIDRDTSGILVCSKNETVHAQLQKDWQAVEKSYMALACGLVDWEACDAYTGHGRSKQGRWRVYMRAEIGTRLPDHNVVRAAHTSFTCLERYALGSLICAQLHTGRTHQIRLHLAGLGHPLLGDGRYGGALDVRGQPIQHHMLHAGRLVLRHPTRNTELEITAPLPPDFTATLHAIRSA